MDRQANIEKSIAYLAADEQVRCRIPSSPGERQRLLRALMNVWEPKELSEEFLAMQDAELQAQAAEPSIAPFSERVEQLRRLVREADYVLIGAGAGLTTAAGLDYAGEDFRREFSEWIARYRFTDLYTAGFYPFETEEERWAYWAKHIWFARYRTGALPLYKELLEVVREKDYFVLTTNVDAQFEMAGFAAERIFATQGDYAFFQPASGEPKELYNNREWVERVLPKIRDCRIPSEMVPHTPDGEPVAMNLRCDNTFVEDARWHEQEARYSAFVQQAADKRLLLLEFGVGFNTPVIIRMPFERMAAQLPDTTLVRFNRDYPQPYQAGIEHFIPFTEDINRIISQLNHH